MLPQTETEATAAAPSEGATTELERRTNLERRTGWRRNMIMVSITIFALGVVLGNTLSRRTVADKPQEQPYDPAVVFRKVNQSVVELHRHNSFGDVVAYGSAVYLGQNFFLTVKHALYKLDGKSAPNGTTVTLKTSKHEFEAQIIDVGNATEEVDSGDWAILRANAGGLTPLPLQIGYKFSFAEPFLRVGNDWDRGNMPGIGMYGRRLENGLVTALTDGHPGVSGGAVTDQNGVLVGISIGRMAGDYRYSFILPLRDEMFRKIPKEINLVH